MIDSYDFGRIVVDGKAYTNDVIIFPDKVKDNWWRKEGHALHIEDIESVVAEKPKVLIVGTGKYGILEVLPETKQQNISVYRYRMEKPLNSPVYSPHVTVTDDIFAAGGP